MTGKKIVLATFGTHGDLHPFIGVGLVLKQHGLEPVIASSAQFRDDVEGAGLRFHPLRPTQEQLEADLAMTRAQMLRTARKRPQIILTKLVLPYLRQSYDDAMIAIANAQLVITSSIAFGAKLAAEKLGIAHIGVVLQPYTLLSAFDPPLLGNAVGLSKLAYAGGIGGARALLQLGRIVSRIWARPIHRFRHQVGLRRTSVHPFFEGQFMDAKPVGLYSRLLGDIQPDFPPGFALAGFSFYDGRESDHADGRDLQSFLDSGPPPLIFTLGTSAIHDSASFVRVALEAVNQLGERALLILDEAQRNALQEHTPDGVFVSGYVQYSKIFHRAKVIVHHGGIGTTAQALRAGRPQLISPYFVDQPDNAARVERLGIAHVVSPEKWTAARVVSELRALLADSALIARAAGVGREIAAENGAAELAAIAIQLLASGSVRSS
jgi:UDP:flavonoid glycosyltransferase YjiC (YdhE family)